MERDAHFQSLLSQIPLCKKSLTSLSKSLVKEPPPCSPNRAPVESDDVSLVTVVYLFIYNSQSPQLWSSPTKCRENMVTVRGAACGLKAYIQLGVACFPKEIIYDTAIATPVLCIHQHDTFHFGLGRTEAC